MRCRFAPSPTGLIHVGNLRSAVLNWVYANKHNGEFILRIDDTDLERSKNEFKESIFNDLDWLGLKWDKTFNQSNRLDLYNKKIDFLKNSKRLYPCFETEEELALKRKSLLSAGKPPIYDRSSLKLKQHEIDERIKNGEKPHWRFRLENKKISWTDLIKGTVSFSAEHLSDPILIRKNGSLLYHLPSVIDDIEENITDIIRGEDHITNSAYHIQIFEALNSNIPNFAHHPFLTDEDGKGFGKRIGSLSINKLKNEGFENISILNYLVSIGSNKDIKPEKNINELIKKFEIESISNSAAIFNYNNLKALNTNTLKLYDYLDISSRFNFNVNSTLKEKVWIFAKNNISFFNDVNNWIEVIDKTFKIEDFNIEKKIINAAIKNLPEDPYDENTWGIWTDIKKENTGFKGKELYMPLRQILTGKNHGPELKYLMPIINKEVILRKFGKI
mgnify:FL=1